MRLKRILSFAVALAMALSVVPSFSITAGAAKTDSELSSIVKASDIAFDGSYAAVQAPTDRNGSNVSGTYTTWKSSYYAAGGDNPGWDDANWGGASSPNYRMGGIQSENSQNFLKFQWAGISGTGTSYGVKLESPKYGSGEANTYVAFEWIGFGAYTDSDFYGNFGLYDGSGKEFAHFALDQNANNQTKFKVGNHVALTDKVCRVVAVNYTDTHDVYYLVDGKVITAEEGIAGLVDGFGGFTGVLGRWCGKKNDWGRQIRFREPKVYAGEIPVNAPVTVQYVDAEDESVLYSYDTEVLQGVNYAPTVATAYYVNETTGYLYTVGTAEPITVKDKDNVAKVPMTKFKTLVEQANGEKNIVTNGSFEDGYTGWTARTGNALSDEKFSLVDSPVSDGTKALHTTEYGAGENADNGISTAWNITAGKEYYVAFDAMAGKSSASNQFMWLCLKDAEGNMAQRDDLVDYRNTNNNEPVGRGHYNISSSQWTTIERLFTADDAMTQLVFEGWWWNDSEPYLDNFKLYELGALEVSNEATVTAAIATVVPGKISAKSGEGLNVPATVNDGVNDFDVTWTVTSGDCVTANGGAVTANDVTAMQSAAIKPSVTFNGKTYEGPETTVYVFPKSVAKDGVTGYKIGNTYYDIAQGAANLITNGSFEDDGFTTGWQSHLADNPDKVFQGAWWNVTEKTATGDGKTIKNYSGGPIPDGDHALGSMWPDDITHAENYCTIDTMWPVEAGKKYYFSFWARSNEGSGNIYAYFTNSNAHHNAKPDHAQMTGNIDTQLTKNWQKFEYIFDATEAGYVGFTAYGLSGDGDNGVMGIVFDDFELYEATVSATYNVVFKTAAGVVLKEEEKLPGETATMKAGVYKGDDDRAYEVTGEYSGVASADGTEVTVTNATDVGAAAITAFGWDVDDRVMQYSNEQGFSTDKKNSLVSTSWNGPRIGVMKFAIHDRQEDQYLKGAYLNIDYAYGMNNNTAGAKFSVYAFNPELVDVDTLKVNSSNWRDLVDETDAIEVASELQPGAPGRFEGKITLREYYLVYPNATNVAIFILAQDSGMVFYNNEPDNNGKTSVPYLTYEEFASLSPHPYNLGGYVMKNNVGMDTPLNEIFMLGAHDSMTSDMTSDDDPGQAISEDAVSISTKSYAQTQKSNIITLLESGVRYLDVRLTREKSGSTTWRATHTKMSGIFGNEDGSGNGYAQQMVDWLHDNPGEIMIFDLQTVYDVDVKTKEDGSSYADNQKGFGNQASFDAIKRVLLNTKDIDGRSLYSYLYNGTGQTPSSLTYGQLTHNGTAACLIGTCKSITDNRSNSTTPAISKFMWRGFFTGNTYTNGSVNPNAKIWSEWPNVYQTSDLYSKLDTIAAKKSSGDYDTMFRIMQGVLSTVSNGLFDTHLVDLIKTAPTTNPGVYNHKNFMTWLDAMPIFMVDYADTTAKTTTRTSTVNNDSGEFNKTVITDLARFNRAKMFGVDYTTDQQITFEDKETGVSVTGSNYELPVTIRLNVVEKEIDGTTTPAAPAQANNIKVAESGLQKVYEPMFRHFKRLSAEEGNSVGELNTEVKVTFKAAPKSPINSIAVMKLVNGAWTDVAHTYDNGVVTLTDPITNLYDTYMLVEVEGVPVNATYRYVDQATGKVIKTVAGSYPEGATLYDVKATTESGIHFMGDDNAYIISIAEAQSKTLTTDENDKTFDINVKIIHENAAIADGQRERDSFNADAKASWSCAGEGLTDYLGAGVDDDGNNRYMNLINNFNQSRYGVFVFNKPAYTEGQAVLAKIPVNYYQANGVAGTDYEASLVAYADAWTGEGEAARTKTADVGAPIFMAEANFVSLQNKTIHPNAYVTFDITGLVANTEGDKIAISIRPTSGGMMLSQIEAAVEGGTKPGFAAYLDVVDGNVVKIAEGTYSKVTKNGSDVTAFMNNNTITVAEGSSVRVYAKDESVIAYTDGTHAYKPGAAVVPDQSLMLEPAALGVSMVNGAQVRIGKGVDKDGKISTESGLRFITIINRNGSLAGLPGAKVSVVLTAEGSTTEVVKVLDENDENTRWQDDDSKTVYTTAITKMAVSNYNRNYTVTVKVEVDGEVFEASSITRSVYQVAAGLLANGYNGEFGEGQDTSGTDYTEMPQILIDVLNAYVNQVGIRLTLADENSTLAIREEGKGAYRGKAFFELTNASTTDNGNGTKTYTCTITPIGDNTKINEEYWNQYVRINNNNSQVATKVTLEPKGDGSYTLTFERPVK